LGVRVDSISLPLINFRKFITDDEKWILNINNRKWRKSVAWSTIDISYETYNII